MRYTITALLISSLITTSHLVVASEESQPGNSLRVNGKRIEERIIALSEYGKNPEGGVSRVAFSEADIQGRKYIISLMEEAGLAIQIDVAGNIVGRREGRNSSLPPILFGSHIDSVPKGGNYDGDVGVIGALECVQVLKENNFLTEHPLEMVVFSDEEGGLVGSRAMVGALTPDALNLMSHSGKKIRDGILAIGGNPDKLNKAKRGNGDIKAFLELHIEQGGTLEKEKIDIGIVEGIVGINWWDVTIEGFANHAGTTPMDQRQDALLAAAQLIIAVNKKALSTPGRQVATVGRIQAEPGAPNVIPGKVVMSLEIRDLSAEKIQQIYEQIRKESETVSQQTGTRISFLPLDATAVPAPTTPLIRKLIEASARELGLSFRLMPSGAGHDAQDIAKIAPMGMIFVPSVGGISHSPKEFTYPKDMENGANVLLQTILRVDSD